MNDFTKPSFNLEQHLEKLLNNALIIPDLDQARHILKNIGYYRLSAYFRPFFVPGQPAKRFLPGTTFDDILQLYVFDRELRLLVLDALERIEISLRAILSSTLSTPPRNAHSYLESSVFNDRYIKEGGHDWLMQKLEQKGKERSPEQFLVNYHRKHPGAPKQPPIWMAVEILTFSEVSRLFGSIKAPSDTLAFESHYGWKFPVLRSWFQTLSVLRNHCAHQSRIWNREFGITPMTPKVKNLPANKLPFMPPKIEVESRAGSNYILTSRRLYFQLAIIQSLLQVVSPTSHWGARLIKLLDKYPFVSQTHMGFPSGWDQERFWQDAVLMARTIEP